MAKDPVCGMEIDEKTKDDDENNSNSSASVVPIEVIDDTNEHSRESLTSTNSSSSSSSLSSSSIDIPTTIDLNIDVPAVPQFDEIKHIKLIGEVQIYIYYMFCNLY